MITIATQQVKEAPNAGFTELVDEYNASVYKFCRSLTYTREDADDLFQDVFLSAFEQFHKISGSDNPKGFLFSIAVYARKSWKRIHARRNRLAPTGELDERVPDGVSLEDSVLASEETRLVREVVAALPEKFKIPITLYYTSEMNVRDIAAALNLPEGTVKRRVFTARQFVEKGLREQDDAR
ncbi:MAG: sigma-70 family RNA polymerase sigma factor [Clostridiales Family XIII bacterium]|nr:sigma-70 family RNA polymerase sigma factor [Clostridiales Family XIII bacterium]